jgi:hypothetical protein
MSPHAVLIFLGDGRIDQREVLQRRQDRIGRRHAKAAAAGLDDRLRTGRADSRCRSGSALPFAELRDGLLQKDVADAAGRAVAAALMHEERHVVFDDLEDVALAENTMTAPPVARSSKVSAGRTLSRAIIVPLGPPTSTAAASWPPASSAGRARSGRRATRRCRGWRQSPQTLNSFVPWLPSVPMATGTMAPLVEDARGMAEGLDVVHHGGIAEIAARDREGRARLRLARQALAGLISAPSSPQT